MAKRNLLRCLLLLLALAPSGGGLAFGAPAARVVRLNVGQSTTIKVSGTITKVHVLNPEIADVATYSRESVTVVGIDGGTTELLVTTARETSKFSVTVTRVEVGRLFKQIREFLGTGIEGIYPRLVGETVVLSGAALTPDDYGRAQRAVQLFGDKVLNLVQFRPSAIEQVNQILRRSGLTDVRARLVGGTLFLEGAVGSAAEMEKLKSILRAYGLNAENLVRVGGDKQILVDVQFVEMRRRSVEELGVEWPSRLAIGSDSAGGAIGTIQGTVPIKPGGAADVSLNFSAPLPPLSVALNMLVNSGRARLLAQPKLVCGSGESAEFLVGGEIPIVMQTVGAFSVSFKDFGIRLNVTPTSDSLGNIQLALHAEVSAPDQALRVANVPGFRTRRFKTAVTVRTGSSIVLSGLFSSEQQKAISKVPLLGHIPILGELFKSRGFAEEKTTLVVFVTPKVVSPDQPWVVNTIRDIQQLYGEYEDEVGWQLLD
ncbi:MAG: pilus assembly protein N-terminal domain-containing protein [Proteobacteria bacterium]|nr:pilus assembly protein N-terminal domain-containing protein [Pseudomonadota bacterium]